MSVLFGLYQPEQGVIKNNGKVVKIKDPNDANDLGIGMVHQHFKLVHNFIVLQNIILGVEITSHGLLKMDDARKRVIDLSQKYGLMVDPDAIIEDITVGMQQRVEILKMLYRDNEILIFDEPTAVLTPQEIEELMKIMRSLANEGKYILFITHKLNEIKVVANRCTVLRKGKYIDTVNVNVNEVTKEELSEMMLGRKVNLNIEKGSQQSGNTVLEVKNLSENSKVNNKKLVDNVSFSVKKGEIVCIAGIDGNGKSELVDDLTGFGPISSGGIILDGSDITHDSIRKRNMKGMAYIPEGGNQQKVIIAREIDLDPQILIAVQTTRGLDVGAIEYIHKQLIEQRDR